ncbi:uncharacterized protein LOC125868432 isoform X1 [Solanum stenotomum]|uniref:uncharacterized protein LOC125868432 isoform X1 n=1 Tax=Solanum stenotomum TaxID=172797 RepID=UPI0020D0410F|nr:uncharacterized protein LOC125868432 isoform X1 [Solanum stenotomum]
MGDEKVKNEAMEIMGLFQVLPRLVVFDLDYTLWPFYCECRSKNEKPSMYPQAKGILHAFKDKGVNVAIASRSPTPDVANAFLQKLEIKSMFVAQEIFSSWTHKTEHFQKINRKTVVPYNEMLFFDDENRNIEAVKSLFVNCSKHSVDSNNYITRRSRSNKCYMQILEIHISKLKQYFSGFKNGCHKYIGGQRGKFRGFEARTLRVC